MKDLLLLHLLKFLESKLVPGKPVLLGYSGGPDSKALLYLLLDCRRFLSFDLHLAHVDHGWRKESCVEAEAISAEAKELGVPLTVFSLSPEDFSPGNLEEQGREYRLDCFLSLYNRLQCQALLLGHHADDQAEVVLKRVFEGASLFSLGGLSPDAELNGMCVLRPLLDISKAQIFDWLSKKGLTFFQDPTNSSSQFLRGRMREEMVPFLKRSFGKEISSNLCRLGGESREVKEYFSALNQEMMAHIRKDVQISLLDLRPFLPIPVLQLKFLLREWMRLEEVFLSRQILENIVSVILNKRTNKRFMSKECSVLVCDGIIYFSKNEKQDFLLLK